jgi:prephenate dehydrogenase
MNEESHFLDYHIAIIGLGLMGGSLAMRLKDRCRGLLAVDPDPDIRSFAIKNQIVDVITDDPSDIVSRSEVIVLAAPIDAILGLIPQLPDLHPGKAVVIDFGSTKTQICEQLNKLPPRFEPIGGHPMCGKEVGGLPNAEADLFNQAPFALTVLPHTTERARVFAENLIQIIGSKSVYLDPVTHDNWVAAVSHLPYILANALILATPSESSKLISTGFKSTTRLAKSPVSVMAPVIQTNKEPILNAIINFRKALDTIKDLIENDDYISLKKVLDDGAKRREDFGN